MGKRIFSILIVMAMCLTLLPTWAWAEEAETGELVVTAEGENQTDIPDADDLPDNDELFAGYVEQTMYAGFNYGISLFGVSAGARLDENK